MPDYTAPYPMTFVGAWTPFRGRYEKRMHLIRLTDGREIGPCWPNAGDFFDCSDEGNGKHIEGRHVTHVRPLQPDGDPYDLVPDPTIYY